MPTTVVTPSLTPSSSGGNNRNVVVGGLSSQSTPSSSVAAAAAPRVPPTRQQPDMNKGRMMFMWLSLVGKTVEVKMRNQTVYQGILSGVKPEKDYDIVLKYARELPTNNKLSGPIMDELLISGKDISSLTAKEVPITGIDLKKGPHLSGFKTDSEILPRSSLAGKERVLQRWDSKTDDALDKPLETSLNDNRITKGGAHWDQFAVNERKFNVKSTYNEDLYTTTLDTSKISPEKQRRAERIAKEIEHSQNYGAKEEGTGADQDEEALFSAVQGTGGYANHKQHSLQQQQGGGVNHHQAGNQQQHSKPQLSPEQISERARMKADFESNLRMLDAGHRHPRAAAASAGNTRLNALNLEPASVRVSHLGRSPKQTSTSPRPPQPLTQENLNSHNRALRYSAVAAAAGGGGSTGPSKGGGGQQQQQTPGSKHSLLGASPVITDGRKPLPQLPPNTSTTGGDDGVSPIVTEMKGINALNLEPALPKLPEKERDDWISSNGGGKGKGGGAGIGPTPWQGGGGGSAAGGGNNGTPPLTAVKGGKGKGTTTSGLKPAKGGMIPPQIIGSPQVGYQQQQQQQHQPSQLMMSAVHNAQSAAAAAAAQQQQQDVGKPPAGKGGRKNLTLEASSSTSAAAAGTATAAAPKRGGFSFNPNANTFTPSMSGQGGQGGGGPSQPPPSNGGATTGQGATLNINVTPGGSLSGTLKNMNYDGYDTQQQQGGGGGSISSNKQQGRQQQQQEQQQQEQQQQYGGRSGLPMQAMGPHGGMIPPPMMGGPGQGPPMGMMIPMPAAAAAHGGYPAAFIPPISLPNISPPPFTPLCNNKALDKSTLIEVEDKLLESNDNENTRAVSVEWPDGSKSSSYKDIISSSSVTATAAGAAAAGAGGPPAVFGAPGGYMTMIPGGQGGGGHMIMQQGPVGGPMGSIPGMMMQPTAAGGGGPPMAGMYQYPIPPPMQQQQNTVNNQQQGGGGGSSGGGMHTMPPPMPPPGAGGNIYGVAAPMYGGIPPPYYAPAPSMEGSGVRGGGPTGGGGYMQMGPTPSGGVLITPDNNESGGGTGLMPSPPPQQQQQQRGGRGGGGGYYGQQGGGRQQQQGGGGGHRGGGYHSQQQGGGGGGGGGGNQ